MSTDRLHKLVERGRNGKAVGLACGIKSLDRFLNRIQRGRYILVGGDSGVGKTTYADAIVFGLMTSAIETKVKLHIKYFTFEISDVEKRMTFICMILAKYFQFECTPEYIFGRIAAKPLTDEHYDLYLKAKEILERDYMPMMDLVDHPLTSGGMFARVISHYETIGTIERDEPAEKGKKGLMTGFTADEEWVDGFTVGVIDHVALGIPERGQDTKRMIDSFSRKAIITRNLFDMTWIVIQQFNSEMTSSNRASNTKHTTEAMISPNRLDFRDSKNTYQDASAVIGLISPWQHGLDKFMNYDIGQMGSHLIVPHLMKNREGPDGKIMPAFVNPLSRTVIDMPRDNNLPALEFMYEDAQALKARCLSYFPNPDE